MYKSIILWLLFSCGGYYSHAQILKVDKGSIDSDSANYWMGSMNLDFNMNNRSATEDQNITFTGLEANADVVYVAPKHAYILINKINYFKSTGGPLISTGYTHLRINFLRRKVLSYESFTQVQYDDGRKMPFRFLQGAGLRIKLSASENAKVFLGTGGMYEKEHWKSLADESQIIEKSIWKTSNYISSKFTFNEHVSFDLIMYYQGGYDAESEVFRSRVSGDVVLNVKVTEHLSFLNSFSAQYEDKPIIPINNFVYSLTNGFKWSF